MSKPVCLLGFMGTGKSAVGRVLAERAGWRFVDLDAEIERAAGMDIPEIFQREGEEGFRDREARALLSSLDTENTVVACGGGVVIRPENRAALRSGSHPVLLTASVETILRRVGNDPHRPLLQSPNPREHLEALLLKRAPWYREFSPGIPTDALTPEEVACKILRETAGRGLRGNKSP